MVNSFGELVSQIPVPGTVFLLSFPFLLLAVVQNIFEAYRVVQPLQVNWNKRKRF